MAQQHTFGGPGRLSTLTQSPKPKALNPKTLKPKTLNLKLKNQNSKPYSWKARLWFHMLASKPENTTVMVYSPKDVKFMLALNLAQHSGSCLLCSGYGLSIRILAYLSGYRFPSTAKVLLFSSSGQSRPLKFYFRSCVRGSNVVAATVWDYHCSLFLSDASVLFVRSLRFCMVVFRQMYEG